MGPSIGVKRSLGSGPPVAFRSGQVPWSALAYGAMSVAIVRDDYNLKQIQQLPSVQEEVV